MVECTGRTEGKGRVRKEEEPAELATPGKRRECTGWSRGVSTSLPTCLGRMEGCREPGFGGSGWGAHWRLLPAGGAVRTHCCGHCPAPGSRQWGSEMGREAALPPGTGCGGGPPPGLCPLLPGGNMWPQALRLCWGQRRQEGPGHLALGFCGKRPRTQKVKAVGEGPRAHNVPRLESAGSTEPLPGPRGLPLTPAGPESLGASLSSLGQGQGQALALVGAFGWQAHFPWAWQR